MNMDATNRYLSVLAYNLETVLAEKLETLLSRGNQNTRLRDYYDVYILTKPNKAGIKRDALSMALSQTARRRGTSEAMKTYHDIMKSVVENETMKRQWMNYQKMFEYASDIGFSEVCSAVVEIMDVIDAENVPQAC